MYGDLLANHIAWFPDSKEDENYNDEIMSKREYQMNANGNEQQNPIFFNHQNLSRIHMSSAGPNRRIFLFKDPGVGKTCDSIGIAESRHEWLSQVFEDEDDPTKEQLRKGKAVIISQNEATQTNAFKADIMNKCTAGAYITQALKANQYKESSRKRGSETTSIKNNYDLHTHVAFSKIIASLTDEQIAQQYSFRVIIIDEVQNFRSQVTGVGTTYVYKKQITQHMQRFMRNVYGSVIVCISATPTVDNIDEFPSVINILLPPNEQIDPIEFREISKLDDLVELRRRMLLLLVPRLRGKISRMKISAEVRKTVVRTNMHLVTGPLMKYSRKELWLSILDNQNSEFIDYTYLIDAYKSSLGSAVIYTNELYASTMVWPGGIVKDNIGQFINIKDGQFAFTRLFMEDFNRSYIGCRNYYIDVLLREVQRLTAQNLAEPSEELADRIDMFQTIANLHQERRNAYQTEGVVYNINNDADLSMMIYTIKMRYSPVFATIISQIIGIEVFNPQTGTYTYYVDTTTNSFQADNQECVYIFNKFIARGIAPICLFLQMFGYSQLPEGDFIDSVTGNIKQLSEAKRYALLYSSDKKEKDPTFTEKNMAKMSDARIAEILRVANHPQNRYGRYLKVIAGTEITAQGINLLNIRQMHMSGRAWNTGQDIQTEGRVDRPAGSHEAFDDTDPRMIKIYQDFEDGLHAPYNVVVRNGVPTQRYVKLFRQVAYFPTVMSPPDADGVVTNATIGLKMYDAAAYKHFKNTIPLDILEDIAYDNRLNLLPIDRVRPPLAAIPDAAITTDYTTYNLFHARKDIERIKCLIRGLFKVQFRMPLVDILGQKEISAKYHQTTIIKALTEMVNDNERIVDRHGRINYLRETNDIFFVQQMASALRTRGDQWMAYYSMHNFVSDPFSIDMSHSAIVASDALSELNRALDEAISKNDSAVFVKLIREMSNSVKMKVVEYVVERYSSRPKDGSLPGEVIDLLFQTLHPNVLYFPESNMIIHVYEILTSRELESGGKSSKNLIPGNRKQRVRVFNISEGQWRNFTAAEGERYVYYINEYVSRVSAAEVVGLSHYGNIINESGHRVFKLQDQKSVIISSSKTNKKTQSATSKAADTKGGQVAGTIGLPKLYPHMWSVEVDILVEMKTYEAVNHPTLGYITPVILQRLQRDPMGQIIFENGGIRASGYVDPKTKASHYITNYPEFQRLLATKPVRLVNLHYRHVYPEILPWVFTDQLAAIPKSILTKANKSFYPVVMKNINYVPELPEMPPGRDYVNLLDILPDDDSKFDMETRMVGKQTSTVAGKMCGANGCWNFYAGSMISISMNSLAQMGAIDTHRSMNEGAEYGARFENSWAGFTKHQLALMIFILYRMTGAIRQ